jgi:hypothetical protein
VVAVATDAKGTTYEGGFGKRVLGQPAEMTPDTVVWIASMTKAITGAAAMQQVERGKLGLDSPAKAVIPYLGEVEVLEGFDAAASPGRASPSATSRCATCSPTPRASATRSGTPTSSSTRRRWACRASPAARTRR